MNATTVVCSFDDDDVATPDGVRSAAALLAAEQDAGRRVVAVLPAMGGTSRWLRELARAVSGAPILASWTYFVDRRPHLLRALRWPFSVWTPRGTPLTGSQAGIITDTRHGQAAVVDVRSDRVREALDEGAIVLVAARQGVSTESEVTALRGGTVDETAAALGGARRVGASAACLRRS